jgi:hypothetical protein
MKHRVCEIAAVLVSALAALVLLAIALAVVAHAQAPATPTDPCAAQTAVTDKWQRAAQQLQADYDEQARELGRLYILRIKIERGELLTVAEARQAFERANPGQTLTAAWTVAPVKPAATAPTPPTK